jgi:hypothetical protein
VLELDKETKNKIRFITFIIPEFAEACKMEKSESYLYLEKYGGLDYIYKFWWTLHTEDSQHAILDIFKICQKNGGYL